MAKRERCEDVDFGFPERREKLQSEVKVKEEDKQGGESALVPIVSHQQQFGAPAEGGDDESDEESQEYYYDYDEYSYSRNPFFSFFGFATQFATQYTAPPKVVPIAALFPGYYGNWAIRGRVAYKLDVRSYDNDNGTGTYFWFEMKDDAGGEIRVVCFTREIAKFYDKVVEGMEHVLSRGRLQRPKDRYNLEGRRCEIVLQYNSTVEAIQGNATPQDNANATAQATEGNADVKIIQRNATAGAMQVEGERKNPENPVEAETFAVKAQNELLLKKVSDLEKNYELVSSRALESSTQLQDCKARLEGLEAIVKEGKTKAQAS